MATLTSKLLKYYLLVLLALGLAACGSAPSSDTQTVTDPGFCTPDKVSAMPYAGGSGTKSDPYLICTGAQLDTLGASPQDWGKSFRLMTDVSLAAFSGNSFHLIGSAVSSAPCVPNTALSTPFSGSFDGNGYAVTGLTFQAAQEYIGLFAYVTGQISNLNVRYVNVSGTGCVGALAGYLAGDLFSSSATDGTVAGTTQGVGGLIGVQAHGNVTQSSAALSVSCASCDGVGGLIGIKTSGDALSSFASGSVQAQGNAGGLIGEMDHGTIEYSFSNAQVSESASNAGGLVGLANNINVRSAYAVGAVTGAQAGGLLGATTGTVSVVLSFATGKVTGTLAGGLIANLAAGGSVSQSYATGAVTATAPGAGGLVGSSQGVLSDSYASGAVSAPDQAGGLVGCASTDSITRSYASGTVTSAGASVGGLLGLDGGGTTITSSYFDDSHNNGLGTFVTSTQLTQAGTFSGWDFVSVWQLNPGAFPTF